MTILTERAGSIAILTLSNPGARNAMSAAMWDALADAVEAQGQDASVRAILLTGAGDHFCGGADITEFAEVFATPEAARAYNDRVAAGQAAVSGVPKPVIAVVEGVAVGAGCGIAAAADLRFAAASARFGMPPARLGASYPFEATRTLVNLIGPARTKDMMFSARLIGAEEAYAIGLADRVVADGTALAEALAYAEALARLSPASMVAAKQMVRAITDGTDAETPALRALFDESFGGDDFREGYRAFLEKRRPDFG